jgi:hypothetical protein
MRAIRLPNGKLLVPIEGDNSDRGDGLAELGPEHPEYDRWLALPDDGEDPRPQEANQ